MSPREEAPTRFISCVFLALLLASPSFATAQPSSSADARAMGTSINRFAVDLYKSVAADENLIFSPFSISMALAMTREGAGGATAEQMDTVLHYPPTLASKQRALADALELRSRRLWSDDEERTRHFELHLANAVWGASDLRFVPKYLDRLRANYDAPMRYVNFEEEPEQIRRTINLWASRQTRQRIPELIPPGGINPSTGLVLTNAIYLKAKWKKPFYPELTKRRTWYAIDGSEQRTPLMHRWAELRYTEDQQVQVVALPYRGDALSMVIVLPRKHAGLRALRTSITHGRVRQWMSELESKWVELALPRWKYSSGFELGRTLRGMGMGAAFDRDANFDGIASERPLFISEVIHKAFIAVDEKGAEAAAATAVVMSRGGGRASGEPEYFNANHPFLYFIRHNATGAILFVGQVMKP